MAQKANAAGAWITSSITRGFLDVLGATMCKTTLVHVLLARCSPPGGLWLALGMLLAFQAPSVSAQGQGERLDLFGDPLPAGAVARLSASARCDAPTKVG